MLANSSATANGILPAQTFSTLERTLVVHSDVSEIHEYLRSAYKRLSVSSSSNATVHNHSQAQQSAAVDTGTILANTDDAWLFFNAAAVDYRDAAINTTFRRAFYGSSKLFRLSFRANQNWHSLYGAGLRIADAAIIISAHSGIGKTTLALELMARGAGFYSDEFVFIRKSDRATSGLPRALMIRERTFSMLGNRRLMAVCHASKPRAPYGDRVWDTIDAGDVFGETIFAQPAPLKAAFVLERAPGPKSSIERIPAALAAADFTRRLNSEIDGFERLTTTALMLAGVPCYRVAACSPRAGADAIESILQ